MVKDYVVIIKGRIKTYFLPGFVVQEYEDNTFNIFTGKHTKPKPGELIKLISRIENLVCTRTKYIAQNATIMVYTIGKIIITHDAYLNIVTFDVPNNVSYNACGIVNFEDFIEILAKFYIDEPY